MILLGSEFRRPLVDWIKRFHLDEFGYISPEDMTLYEITDEVDLAAEHIVEYYGKMLDKRRGEAVASPAMTPDGTCAGRQPQRPRASRSYEDLQR